MKTIRELLEPYIRKVGINEVDRLMADTKAIQASHWLSGEKRMKESAIQALCKRIGVQLEVGGRLQSFARAIGESIPDRGRRALCREIKCRGVSSATLSEWLAGKRQFKDFQLDAICAHLGLRVKVVPRRDFANVKPPRSGPPKKADIA